MLWVLNETVNRYFHLSKSRVLSPLHSIHMCSVPLAYNDGLNFRAPNNMIKLMVKKIFPIHYALKIGLS